MPNGPPPSEKHATEHKRENKEENKEENNKKSDTVVSAKQDEKPNEKPKEQSDAEVNAQIAATLMAMTDSGPTAPGTAVFQQGDFQQPKGEVSPGFLSVFDPNPAPISPPTSGKSTGRRTALAAWIAALTTRLRRA